MTRKLKSAKVDEVRHANSGITVDIMLDRNALTFHAEAIGQHFSDKTAEKVKQEVYRHIERTFSVEWLPVIEIRDPRGHDCHFCPGSPLSLQYKRYYLGDTGRVSFTTRTILQLEWDYFEEFQDASKRLEYARIWSPGGANGVEKEKSLIDVLPLTLSTYSGSRASDRRVLRYDVDVWAGLEAVTAMIKKAEADLFQLVWADATMPLVKAAGASGQPLLLGAGAVDD